MRRGRALAALLLGIILLPVPAGAQQRATLEPSAAARAEMLDDSTSTGRLVGTGAVAGLVIGTVVGGMIGLESNDEYGMLVIIPGAVIGTGLGALIGLIVANRR